MPAAFAAIDVTAIIVIGLIAILAIYLLVLLKNNTGSIPIVSGALASLAQTCIDGVTTAADTVVYEVSFHMLSGWVVVASDFLQTGGNPIDVFNTFGTDVWNTASAQIQEQAGIFIAWAQPNWSYWIGRAANDLGIIENDLYNTVAPHVTAIASQVNSLEATASPMLNDWYTWGKQAIIDASNAVQYLLPTVTGLLTRMFAVEQRIGTLERTAAQVFYTEIPQILSQLTNLATVGATNIWQWEGSVEQRLTVLGAEVLGVQGFEQGVSNEIEQALATAEGDIALAKQALINQIAAALESVGGQISSIQGILSGQITGIEAGIPAEIDTAIQNTKSYIDSRVGTLNAQIDALTRSGQASITSITQQVTAIQQNIGTIMQTLATYATITALTLLTAQQITNIINIAEDPCMCVNPNLGGPFNWLVPMVLAKEMDIP